MIEILFCSITFRFLFGEQMSDADQIEHHTDTGQWRDLWAFWMIGLCQHNGFVVMLSASHDIMRTVKPNDETNLAVYRNDYNRACNILSTGVILLSAVTPGLILKLIMPFLPLCINLRMFLAISLSMASFGIVAFATVDWLAYLGVALTSASGGIRETAMLAYSTRFHSNVISAWSSGYGAAGIIGAFGYAALHSLGLSLRFCMLIMLVYPVMEIVFFWCLLRVHPDKPPLKRRRSHVRFADEEPLPNIYKKILFIPKLAHYMLPLFFIFFFEYFINMGLYELVFFGDAIMDKQSQFRWFCFGYQLGVFISSSTVNVFQISKIWFLAILQGINVLYFVTEVLWFHTPTILITLFFVFMEGYIGGLGYVNTYYRITHEITPKRRQFCMSVVTIADSLGVLFAGIVSIPVHEKICSLPEPVRRD